MTLLDSSTPNVSVERIDSSSSWAADNADCTSLIRLYSSSRYFEIKGLLCPLQSATYCSPQVKISSIQPALPIALWNLLLSSSQDVKHPAEAWSAQFQWLTTTLIWHGTKECFLNAQKECLFDVQWKDKWQCNKYTPSHNTQVTTP